MYHKIISSFVLFLSIYIFVAPSWAVAKEYIDHYDVSIKVDVEGDLYIHEKIKVYAAGFDIKRGIYRDLPLKSRSFLGGKIYTEYNITSVKRDGLKEPYHTKNIGDNLRIYIGRTNVILPPNKFYSYEIEYNVPQQILSYDFVDEIYWNAIGTNWKFPIQNASVEVVFPSSARIEDYKIYTGKFNSKDNMIGALITGNKLNAQIEKPLAPYEGLTIAASIPKGFVKPNDSKTGLLGLFDAHPGLLTILIGLITSTVWSYFVWLRVGKDPKSRGLIPFYMPPEDISPAEAAYIKGKEYVPAQKLFSIGLITLASKGWIEIDEYKKSKYAIKKVSSNTNRKPLTLEEKSIYDNLKDYHVIENHDSTLIKSSRKYAQAIDYKLKGIFYKRNIKAWFKSLIPAAFILFVMPFALGASSVFETIIFYMIGIFVFIACYIASAILYKFLTKQWWAVFKIPFIMLHIGFLILFAIFISETAYGVDISYLVSFMGLVLFSICAYFSPLICSYTPKGRDALDHIEGLKYYMEAVEEKILKKFDPPEMSRQLYEELFPYAVALDVESKWGDKFIKNMALLTVGSVLAAGALSKSPSWYASSNGGSGFSESFDLGNFTRNFERKISQSASVRPSSSSGGYSSGGGSSGGGGGGGGGGGW